MDVLAHVLASGHRVDHVGREVVWMRAREPDPADAFDRIDPAQQVGEQWSSAGSRHREVAAERVDVLTQERDFDHAACGQPLDLGKDVPHRSRQLRSSHEWNDAERAGVVASGRDRHPRLEIVASHGRQRGRERLRRLRHVHLWAFRGGALDQLEQAGERVGSHDDVDPWSLTLDRALVLLREAPGDHDPHPGFFCLSGRGARVAVEAVVGVLPDGAGVEHDDLGLGGILGGNHPAGLEQPGDPLGIVFVHLAPEGAKEVSALLHGLRAYRAYSIERLSRTTVILI